MESQVYKINSIESCLDFKEIIFVLAKDNRDNVIVVCNYENIYPVNNEQNELLVFPVQTISDRQYQALRQKAILTAKEIKLKGLIVIKCALKPKQIKDQLVIDEDDIKILDIITGKNDYVDYSKYSVRLAVDKIQKDLIEGQSLDKIKIDQNLVCYEAVSRNVFIVDIKKHKYEKAQSLAGCFKKIDLVNNLPKNIEIFYKKELNRIDELEDYLSKVKFLNVWDIKQAKKYGFTNLEIANLCKESLKEIDAICVGNDIN
jgi:hypothetical protein